MLNELKEVCGDEREIQIFRELTKKFEEQIGNNINEVIEFLDGKDILGEITIVINGFSKNKDLEFDKSYLKRELHDLIDAGLTLSSASKYLAKKNNLKKSIIYNLY